MSEISKKIALNLLKQKAVKVKVDPPFTWASGIKSPVYCDNRKMIAFPLERGEVVDAFEEVLKARVASGAMEMPDIIGGTATAAIPWAAFLAYKMGLPMVYIRKEVKDHGDVKLVEGSMSPGQKVLVVEDLISSGGSSVSAVNAVRREGGVVTDVFSIVSWEMPGVPQLFADASLTLTNLTGFTDIIGLAHENGDLSAEQFTTVMDFKNDMKGWGAKYGF